MIEHHNLINEFPEYRERIHDLKVGNTEFAELYRQYQDVDKEIYRIEEGIENHADTYTEDLKKKRVHLKDRLYDMLRSA